MLGTLVGFRQAEVMGEDGCDTSFAGRARLLDRLGGAFVQPGAPSLEHRLVGDARAPRAPRHLLVIPIFWSVIAGAVAWELAIPEDLLLPVAAAVALGFSFMRPR